MVRPQFPPCAAPGIIRVRKLYAVLDSPLFRPHARSMFRASPGANRKSLLRRLTASVLGAVLGVTLIAEPMLADVCDGDAPAAARLAVSSHPDVAPFLSGAGAARQIATVRSVENADDGPSIPASPSDTEHSVHVCHCVHAHGGTLGRRPTLNAPSVLNADMMALQGDRVPLSAALEPPLRPPASPYKA